MFIKRITILSLFITLVFCFNNNDVLAADNINNPENIEIKSYGKSLVDFIPKDWKIISEVQGDLNKDKLKDIATIIEYTGKYKSDTEEWTGQPRILFMIFKKNNGTYKLSVQAEIMRSEEGGVFGDPFVGMKYSRGSIIISYYGGSTWRWGFTDRYRFQNNDWYLIGETELSEDIHTGKSETIDTNCLTGKQIITSVDKNGKKKVVTRYIRKKKLEKLTD